MVSSRPSRNPTPRVPAAENNSAGWCIGAGDLSGGRVYWFNESFIELHLSQVSDAEIESATLNLYVQYPIQDLNFDNILANLYHLQSPAYTGDAANDWFGIQGPPPVQSLVHSFPSSTAVGWHTFDVTELVRQNLQANVEWAAFWRCPR